LPRSQVILGTALLRSSFSDAKRTLQSPAGDNAITQAVALPVHRERSEPYSEPGELGYMASLRSATSRISGIAKCNLATRKKREPDFFPPSICCGDWHFGALRG